MTKPPPSGAAAPPHRAVAPHVRLKAIVALWAALLGGLAEAAAAQEPASTAQARLANAEFLASAPAPSNAGAICIVDSGVNVTPDTEAALLARHALDGGTPDDVYVDPESGTPGHGTYVASLIAAPGNGWGSVGIWPAAKIVSVRAMRPGERTFAFGDYTRGIRECFRDPRVVVVELALGRASTDGATASELAALEDEVEGARRRGLNVVAAAGNDGGAVDWPARHGPVVAVGATSPAEELCVFSARGPELDIVAPGCPVETALLDGRPASANGTSFSSPLVAGVLAALRSYRPELGVDEGERLLLGSARTTPAGKALDAEAAFRAAGLGHLVDATAEPDSRAPTPQAGPSPAGTLASPGLEHRAERTRRPRAALPRPRLRGITWRRPRLTVAVTGVPRGARMVVRVGRRTYRPRGRVVRARVRAWRRISVRFHRRGIRSSPALVLRRRSFGFSAAG